MFDVEPLADVRVSVVDDRETATPCAAAAAVVPTTEAMHFAPANVVPVHVDGEPPLSVQVPVFVDACISTAPLNVAVVADRFPSMTTTPLWVIVPPLSHLVNSPVPS